MVQNLLILGLVVALLVAIFPVTGYLGKRHMGRTWRPEVAGVLEMLGVAFIIFFLYWSSLSPETIDMWIGLPYYLMGMGLGLVGGVFALRKRRYVWALIGAIALSVCLIGIPALILVILSKKEFQPVLPRVGQIP